MVTRKWLESARGRQSRWDVTAVRRAEAALALAENGGTAYLLPGTPEVERSPIGTPAVTLLGTPTSAFLQIGAHWWPDVDRQRSMLAQLAAGSGIAADQLVLASDGLTNVQASVHLMAGEEDAVLATSSTSLTPPYTATFSIGVSGDQIDRVRAAIAGERGVLEVRYEGEYGAVPLVSTVLTAAVVDGAPDEGSVTRWRTGATDLGAELINRADVAADAALVAAARITGGDTRLRVVGVAWAEPPSRLAGVADVASWTESRPEQHVVLVGENQGE
jgi:hypothetical protein